MYYKFWCNVQNHFIGKYKVLTNFEINPNTSLDHFQIHHLP